MIYFRCNMAIFLPFIFTLFFLCGCAGSKQAAPPVPASPPDLVGLSKAHTPEAETLFAKARVLWRGSIAATPAGASSCSDPKKALELLSKTLEIEPGYAEAYIWRGLARIDLGQKEEAFEDATAGIRLHPAAEAYAARGLISLRAKNFSGARKDLEYSLTLDSKNPQAKNHMGVLLLAQGDAVQACEWFDKACSSGDCSLWEAAEKEKICR